MKSTILSILIVWSGVAWAQHEHHTTSDTTQKTQKNPLSPRLSAMAMVGSNHVHIDYGSPSVRGRNIWNGLVAYNQVWATGAHKASWIDFGQDVMIQGKHIPKGKYGFFAIPSEKEWTLILSKDSDRHLADDYTPAHDALRLQVKPQKNEKLVEALTYTVLPKGDKKGTIQLSWEWVNVSNLFKLFVLRRDAVIFE
jgi:hypothetical protein